MSSPTFATEQLLELMLQLKKTTPDAARQILNSQPQIAYALMTLMVNMNAVNIQVFQKTLSDFAAKSVAPVAPAQAPTPVIPVAQPQVSAYPPAPTSVPASAVPPHVQPQYQQQYRTTTPPAALPSVPPPAAAPATSYPSYTNGYGATAQQYPGYGQLQPAPTQGYYGQHQQQPQSQYPGYGYASNPAPAPGGGYGAPPAPPPAASLLAALPPQLQETLAVMPEEQRALLIRVVSMTPDQINALPPHERQTHIQLRATLGLTT